MRCFELVRTETAEMAMAARQIVQPQYWQQVRIALIAFPQC